jgi:hypothetical protein
MASDPPKLHTIGAAAKAGRVWPLFLLAALFASNALLAQYQKAPPDFGGTYAFPTPAHPEPRAAMLRPEAAVFQHLPGFKAIPFEQMGLQRPR